MKNWMIGGVFLGLMAVVSPASAQKNGQVITSGSGFSYVMSTPAGWESIPGKAKEQGLRMIIVPQGSSWESSQTVLYSGVTDLDGSQGETVYDIIDRDLEMYVLSDPDLIANDKERIDVDRGRTSAHILKVQSPKAGTYEAIAYVPEPGRVPYIVMSSIDEAAFMRDYPAFVELVKSFKYYDSMTMVRGK